MTATRNPHCREPVPLPEIPTVEGCDLFRETLQRMWDQRGNVDYLWLVDEEVWLDGSWDDFFESFAGCDADFLASDVRVFFEDPRWPWWTSLRTPYGTLPPRGERLMAAFLPVTRLSIRALESVLQGLENGWSGHPEAVVPTLIRNAGWIPEDLGGTGSFTPEGRRDRWYNHDSWHWRGPIRHAPGKLHYPKNSLPFRPE